MSQRAIDIQKLKTIIAEKDESGIDGHVYHCFRTYPRDEEIMLLICQIFESDWHHRQEDLALSFQQAKNPATATALFNMALTNDSSDGLYALQRKCTWALADIGTEAAKNYLLEIEKSSNQTVAAFATKRLTHWESELSRKGQVLRSEKHRDFKIILEKYHDSLVNLPSSGQRIIGNSLIIRKLVDSIFTFTSKEKTEEYIVVYQAYKRSIAEYAVAHQQLGGPDFSYARMSWIKPNFLWMMFRSGWAEKENQERVLAIWIKKKAFEEILRNATFTSFEPAYFAHESDWRKELERKKVRLQWDPDHNYLGEKLARRAIQLGLKDEVLEKFGKKQIECIMDITDFVREQKMHINNQHIDRLLIPKERIIQFEDRELMKRVGVD
ncbi:MAG: DUF4291 domain-containing protein [Saprospiraceae bacterium]|nr:DUF4291 domain-containing protein [Saprospiraceae bacterium]